MTFFETLPIDMVNAVELQDFSVAPLAVDCETTDLEYGIDLGGSYGAPVNLEHRPAMEAAPECCIADYRAMSILSAIALFADIILWTMVTI